MKQPILFIIFNRLDTTQQVFSSIREYQPELLYVAADGAREDKKGESKSCQLVRDWVTSNVDWDCEVKTLFQDKNLGCGIAPSTAISWFFEQEEEGIILEDDCVPNQDFFVFCEQLLDYYRNDNRISIISGCNFDVDKKYALKESYFYSVFPYTWGWATWRRNWTGYDYNLSEWKHLNKKRFLSYLFNDQKYTSAWEKLFNKMSKDIPSDIWDYQFFFQCFKRKQLSIVPSCNLVTNIGDGELATHTVSADNPKINIKTEMLSMPLIHPEELERNLEYDIFLQELNYGIVEQVSLSKRLKRFVKKLIKKFKA